MDDFESATEDRLNIVEYIAIFEGQALEDRADDLALVSGDRLAGLLAKGADTRGHIAGREEALVVGFDKGGKRRGILGQGGEFAVGEVATLARPSAAALLHQP